MLADDDQFANFLTMNGMLDSDAVARLRISAELEEKPLYVTVIEKGAVAEGKLVAMMSQLLGVASVALSEFEGDPEIMAMLPIELIRDGGVLPVGIDDGSGTPILFVAMANPGDSELMLAVQARAGMQVAPLLAGPVDLLAAIERNLGSLSRLTHRRHPSIEMPLMPNADDEVDLLDNVSGFGHGGEMRSALGLLDDIPRDRHEQVTSPSGMISLAEMVNSQDETGGANAGLRLGGDSALSNSAMEFGERAFDAAGGSPFGEPGAPAAQPSEADAGDVSGFVRFSPVSRAAPSAPTRKPEPQPAPAPAPASGPMPLRAPSSAPSGPTGSGSQAFPFFAPSKPDLAEQTGFGMPADQSSGAFRRLALSASNASIPGVTGPQLASPNVAAMQSGFGTGPDITLTESPEMLIRALASILMRRGLVTERELRDEITQLRAAIGKG